MKLLTAGLALSVTGCLWANQSSDAMGGYSGRVLLGDHGVPQGGVLDAEIGAAGLYVGAEMNAHHVESPGDTEASHALGFQLDLKASIPGIGATSHDMERRFDFGLETGGGFIMVVDTTHEPNPIGAGAAYLGGWFEIGTYSVGDHYISVVGDLRREVYGAPWSDQTLLTLGLAWRHRELLAIPNARL